MDFYDILFAKKLNGGSSTTIEKLNVTENGTYTADDGRAYSPVNVNVSQPTGTINITSNGIIDVTDYETANVEVSLSGQYQYNFIVRAHCTTESSLPNNMSFAFSYLVASINNDGTIYTREGFKNIENISGTTLVTDEFPKFSSLICTTDYASYNLEIVSVTDTNTGEALTSHMDIYKMVYNNSNNLMGFVITFSPWNDAPIDRFPDDITVNFSCTQA